MANKHQAKNVTIDERINEFISKFDNEEAASEIEQVTVKHLVNNSGDVMHGLLPNGYRCKNVVA